MTKFRRTVDDVSEYKEVVSHAEALGFEAIEHYACGKWEDNKGIPVFLNKIEVEKVGRKYSHIQCRVQTVSNWFRQSRSMRHPA